MPMFLKNIFTSLLILTISVNLFSQETKAKIENVDFYVEDKNIVVTYDIVNYSHIEKFLVNLKFEDPRGETIDPTYVYGDIKYEVPGGKGKKIVWEVLKDGVEIKGNIKAVVTIEEVKLHPGYQGNAGLSLLVPGLGDKYVCNTKQMKFKPVYRTILTYGLMGYGIFQKINSTQLHDEYYDPTKQTDIDLYNRANNAHHQYYIATRAAATIWTYDVLWVFAKGAKNKKLYSCNSTRPVFYLTHNQNSIGFYFRINL